MTIDSHNPMPWNRHERCDSCGEGHMANCPKHESAPNKMPSLLVAKIQEILNGPEVVNRVGRAIRIAKLFYTEQRSTKKEKCRACGGVGIINAFNPDDPSEMTACPDCPRKIWRQGTKLGRTLYINDVCVGMVDTPEIAKAIVDKMNDVT